MSLERVEELLDLPCVPRVSDAIAVPADARGALRFESVSVAAAVEGRPVLDSVTVDIPAGSKVVLRGASGAGKSTLADLLRRFVDPDSGRILLGWPAARAITGWPICAGASWSSSIRRCCSADPFSTICAMGIDRSTRPTARGGPSRRCAMSSSSDAAAGLRHAGG